MSPAREEKFRRVAASRQPNLTVILENVFDTHNIGAVLRSCDSVGIMEIFVLHSEFGKAPKVIKLGKRTSAGARKWIDIQYYADVDACFEHVRKNYEIILGTHLSTESKSLYELDLTQSIALVFGNERDGISSEVLPHLDGNFIVPQVGMVESLNISVACAVTLFEAFRQRQLIGNYSKNPLLNSTEQNQLVEEYDRRHKAKESGEFVQKIK